MTKYEVIRQDDLTAERLRKELGQMWCKLHDISLKLEQEYEPDYYMIELIEKAQAAVDDAIIASVDFSWDTLNH